MEITGASSMMRSMPGCLSSGRTTCSSARGLKLSAIRMRQRGASSGFVDRGHLEYYYGKSVTVCGERKTKEAKGRKGYSLKKRMKLAKGLDEDLTTFSELGFELGSHSGFADDDSRETLAKATETLLAQLKRMQDEEKMRTKPDCESSSSSSSSSSESSDSECDEVLDMSQLEMQLACQDLAWATPISKASLKDNFSTGVQTLQNSEQMCCKDGAASYTATVLEPVTPITKASLKEDLVNEVQPAEREKQLACRDSAPVIPILEASLKENFSTEVHGLQNSEKICCKDGTNSSHALLLEQIIEVSRPVEVACSSSSTSFTSMNAIDCGDPSSMPLKKVEICMGGKCKKSGAPALMEEFQRVLGFEGAVVGCKCMGKCKSGPNVRVTGGCSTAAGVSNPLCIGVGLDDVGLIAANYLGEVKELGLAVTS